MTFDLDLWPTDLNINRDHLLIKVNVPTKFEAQGVGDQHDLWPWPTDLNINRDRLLIKNYLPTKFEASGGKTFFIYQLHKV